MAEETGRRRLPPQFVEQDVFEPGTRFIPAVHGDAVCEHLQAMIENRIKDLIFNIPPSFAKSMIGAVFFPARDRALGEAFVDECASFPNGKYDDQVD